MNTLFLLLFWAIFILNYVMHYKMQNRILVHISQAIVGFLLGYIFYICKQ